MTKTVPIQPRNRVHATPVCTSSRWQVRRYHRGIISARQRRPLGSGWLARVVADGDMVTIEPDSSQTIYGAVTLVLHDSESALVFFDRPISAASERRTRSDV